MKEPEKIPRMSKAEYDDLIRSQHISRIAFRGDVHPYVTPFMYVFDGKFLYFLSTRYGRKIAYFKSNPRVSVEIEEYAPIFLYSPLSLQGSLEEVQHPAKKKEVRNRFINMIRQKRLSPKALATLGHSPGDPFQALAEEERSMVWKLIGVTDIVALKNR